MNDPREGVSTLQTEEALALIETIDRTMADRMRLESVHPDVFHALENADAGRREYDAVRSKIADDIFCRLVSVANSVYFGTLRAGTSGSLYDIVSCLGSARTKALIIALASQSQAGGDPELETIFARSYATSVMASILASRAGFRDEAVLKAEICGLFLEIGKKVILLYRKANPGCGDRLDGPFIESYHHYLGEKIVGRYGLPGYLRTAILARALITEENDISLAGIVQLAYDTVHASFQRYDNRLVIKFQTPRPGTDVTRTIEAILTEKFKAVGLERYLYIIRIPRVFDL